MNTSTENEDVASIIARNFVDTKYNDLPSEVVQAVKKSVLDTLGVTLASSTMVPECRWLAELVKEEGGKEESTIIGFGGRAPAWMAAFVNGGLVHGLDYDDTHHGSSSHPSGPLMPAAFAIAERVGRISGKDFITAIALGHDMLIRMTYSIGSRDYLNSFTRFTVLGVFAAAATCGKLMRLTEEKMRNAIAIALCYSAGTHDTWLGAGSGLRPIIDAFPNKGGVISAIMADKGITGPRNSLEGERAFFNAYYQGKYERDILISDLGQRFEGTSTGYKPWPSCAGTHSCIDATLRLVNEHDITAGNIEGISLIVSERARHNFEPAEVVRKPETLTFAQWSLPFTVAVAAAKRRVVLDDFTPEGIRDEVSLGLAQRVVPRFDPQLSTEGITPCTVEIKMKDGRKYSMKVDFPYGDSRNPMIMEDIIRKFKDCATHSAKPLSQEQIRQVIQMVNKLEEVDDVSQIVRPLG
ncbi:MmgE/PrpD family protein [Chloroflexota bacterium]